MSPADKKEFEIAYSASYKPAREICEEMYDEVASGNEIRYSLILTHTYLLILIHSCLFTHAYSLMLTYSCLLTHAYSLMLTHPLMLTHSPLLTHAYSLMLTHSFM